MPQSHNRWPCITSGLWALPAVTGSVKSGSVWVVLNWLVIQYTRRVETITRAHSWGWSYRKVAGSNVYSNHASGTAVDFNATAHPSGQAVSKTFTPAQIAACRDIEKLSTVGKTQVLNWGDNIPDGMHWEVAKGVSSAQVKRLATTILQRALNRADTKPALVVDGVHGKKTAAALRAYQAREKLVVDGVDGPKTWKKLGVYVD